MQIHHIGYLVSSITDALAEFITLGYQQEQEILQDKQREVFICFVRNEDWLVELICPDSKDSPIYPLLKRYKNSPYHICYSVFDINSEMENLVQRGYFVTQEPLEAPAISYRKVAFLIHRHMGLIELVEV